MTHPRRPATLTVYEGLVRLVEPGITLLLNRRARKGKEDPERLGEREGIPALPRPDGRLVWLHAASVGEINSVLPLIRRLAERDLTVLVTTVTISSAKICAQRLPAKALHQYVPVDVPESIERFLDHWKPDLVLFVEQELWPNTLAEIHRRNVPLALVNGRMSPKSFNMWRRLKGLGRYLVSAFDVVLAQSEADAERFRALGAPRVETPGNLKFDTPELSAPADLVARLDTALAGRPAWVAASTQPGEEEIVLAAHAEAAKAIPNLVLLLAPRHPPRGDEVATLIETSGRAFARRSRNEWPDATDVFLVDVIGELGVLYRAGSAVFMGGSLIEHGGQNPIEPAQLSRAVLHGPHVHNFAEVYDALRAAGGAEGVTDASELAARVVALVGDLDARAAKGEAARVAVGRLGGGLDRTMSTLEPFLSAPRGAS